MPRPLPAILLAAAAGLLVAATPAPAAAFCGFYVSGADAQLYNNATMVVLMRDGTRTVLSMQNNYDGPPQDFAMVVPVPVVLQEADVKTLPHAIFGRVDLLAAPRLVEYWEQDPCAPPYDYQEFAAADEDAMPPPTSSESRRDRDLGVTIESQFTVGEYQILVLSAKDSTGLDTWLRINNYRIPSGAEPLLRPYVQGGMKFFVAKVDVTKVRSEGGRLSLSPLRFHYDSPDFALPVRLGLINSAGAQDLLVHILARGVRYEVANYPNVAIPTNLEVSDAVRQRFGEFYAALFDRVLAQNPQAVVTEYAWAAGSCDPCPESPLDAAELATLGADVLPTYERALRGGKVPSDLAWQLPSEFVLTRLHARYGAASLGEDLVFQAAPAIVGGRELMDRGGALERGARPAEYGDSAFQARYIIRHPWPGAITCDNPQRGIWGGPWPDWEGLRDTRPVIAKDLAFVARDGDLSSFLAEELPPELAVPAAAPLPPGPIPPPDPDPKPVASGCARCAVEPGPAPGQAFFGVAALLGLCFGLRRRRRAAAGGRAASEAAADGAAGSASEVSEDGQVSEDGEVAAASLVGEAALRR